MSDNSELQTIGETEIEYRELVGNSEYRWLANRMALGYGSEGIPVYRRGAIRDFTERKLIEDQLRQSEERFRSVLENSVDCIYRYNYHTQQYDYASPSCHDTVGFSLEEFLNLTLDDAMYTIHPDDRDRVKSSFGSLRPGVGTEIEYRQRDDEGNYRWLSNHLTLIVDEGGWPLYRYGNIRNITERKRVEQELQQLEAERANLAARQIKISETVQRSLLLTPAPDAYPGILTYPHYQPAFDEALVGGDFYDIYPIADGLIAFVVGDAAGKGVAAATYTAEVKFALRAYMKECLRPHSIITASVSA